MYYTQCTYIQPIELITCYLVKGDKLGSLRRLFECHSPTPLSFTFYIITVLVPAFIHLLENLK